MKIQFFQNQYNKNNPCFTAHSYKINSNSSGGGIKVITDNDPYLGERPYLVYYNESGKKFEEKMEKVDGLYLAETRALNSDIQYHIEYKDTNAVDLKNGKEYFVPYKKLMYDVIQKTRMQHNKPLIHAIKKGSAVGKLLFFDHYTNENIDINEPAIVVARSGRMRSLFNPKILGYIMIENDMGTLCHSAAGLRHQTELSAAVLDKDSIEKLLKYVGKNVEISVDDNFLDIKETDKQSKLKTYPQIEVPSIKYCNEILTSDKYSPELIGAKAVNLKRLEELVDQGKIDAIIPKSVGLPNGFIEENFSCPVYQIDKEKNEKFMLNFMEKLKEYGLETDKTFMIRSAFNGEDLANYSAAGLYASYLVDDSDFYDIYSTITSVAKSKNFQRAIESRRSHRIPDERIKPSIVIQNFIKSDYIFTVYTQYNKDELRIELYSPKEENIILKYCEPHVFIYDKKNKRLTYESIQMGTRELTYDENFNVIDFPDVEVDLSHNKELFKQLQKLVDNALVIEKEFNAPQDIEGGIIGDDIYLWQTRNIVNPEF